MLSLIFNYLSFYSKKDALQLVNDMGIGYNLGNTYNCCNIIEDSENEEIKLFGATLPTKNLLKEIRKNGFKTIRFQIVYNDYLYDNYTINEDLIYKLKELIILIRNLNMYLILSIKHSREFWDSEKRKAKHKFINFWKQIANELINYDEHLIFESMYEVGYLAYLNKKNNYYEDKDYYLSQDFINIVRDSGGYNNQRLLIVPMLNSEYELAFFNYEYSEYKIPKDPYHKLAISINYYFPCGDYTKLSPLRPISVYDKSGIPQILFPYMEWGSIGNYKDLVDNFSNLKKNFTDKGIPVIISEVGIINDYIKKDNSIEQLLYTIFSMSSEFEGILPCLWDIPFVSSNHQNFYFNKKNSKWSKSKYQQIFIKISKGKYIKSLDYFYQSSLETTEDSLKNGDITIYTYAKKIIKVFINVSFFVHLKHITVMTITTHDKDSNLIQFQLKEVEGRRQYDGTSVFTIDGLKLGLHYYVRVTPWFGTQYMIINNLTIQYEDEYLFFHYNSYKEDVLNDIDS